MKDLSYDEAITEIQNPIYKDSAKSIWDKTFSIYGDDLEPFDIGALSLEIVLAIDIESRNTTEHTIFEILEYDDSHDQISFIQEYITCMSTTCNLNCMKFVKDNIETLCRGDKFNLFIQHIKDIADLVGKDLMLLIDGGYLCGEKAYLVKYIRQKLNRKATKDVINNVWKLQQDNNEIWEREEDIILYNMSFVWNPQFGYSRFLDNNGRWGFVNVLNGKMNYMPSDVHHVRDYSCGVAAYQDINNGLYGFIDIKGNVKIEPKFYSVMDFIYVRGKSIAAVEFSDEEKYKLCHDSTRSAPWGGPREMQISIFDKIITIDLYGNLTSDIQEIYDREVLEYTQNAIKEDQVREIKEKKQKEKELMKLLLSNDYDDEDDIMNALEGGYGDYLGF